VRHRNLSGQISVPGSPSATTLEMAVAVNAQLGGWRIAVDAAGNLYISDGSARVRKIISGWSCHRGNGLRATRRWIHGRIQFSSVPPWRSTPSATCSGGRAAMRSAPRRGLRIADPHGLEQRQQ
jgi:hypothetical protein